MFVRPTQSLTYAGARAAVAAAVSRAEEIGVAVNVAVTDGSGTLLAFARMDGAFAFSGAIAVDKARTVCGFGGVPSDALYDAIAGEPPVRDGIAGRAEVAAFAGGVPVRLGDDLVGAVGVSGPSALVQTILSLGTKSRTQPGKSSRKSSGPVMTARKIPPGLQSISTSGVA